MCAAPVQLPPGANAPLTGGPVVISLTVPQLGGAAFVAESGDPGEATVVPPESGFSSVAVPEGGREVTATVDLAAVPAALQRLRLLVWSPAPALPVARITAGLTGPGDTAVELGVPADTAELRALELLELYRRGDGWKVRAVASGWAGHVPAMAHALGVPAAAFPLPAAPTPAAAPPRPTPPADLPDPDAPHEGPSPPVGPPALRGLLDEVVGPGARFGDTTFVDFSLHGVLLRLSYERSGDYARVIATSPGGEGELTDAVALAALRATGEAPLASVSFAPDGTAAFVSAPVVAPAGGVDSALLKALLAEVWVTAHRFNGRMKMARGWQRPAQLTEQIPRELRLGFAEELQDEDAWTDVRMRLLDAGGLPLVDGPGAVLIPSGEGQLAVGPSLLSGTSRAWAIVVERTLRANVRPQAGLWKELVLRNHEAAFVRIGVQDEGLPGDPPAIHVNFSALQLPRTPVVEDLARGLEMVDRAADGLDDLLRRLAADSADYRNNLPWPPTRRWTGPGAEVTEQLLVRELADLPAGAAPPAALPARAQAQAAALGRPGLGYLAHLALLRAEAGDEAAAAWRDVARELVGLAPIEHAPGDAPCATASIHVRMHRLDAPRPMRPPPAPRRTGLRGRLFG